MPGSGTFGMEAVARQFATGQHCLVIRNGFFSYRWTQIFEAGSIPESHTVMTARRARRTGRRPPSRPPPIDEVVATIETERPAVVFAPHVETSSGMILPDDYMRAVADATHAVGGLFVLDCIASGTIWVDMADIGVDVLVSAPQKGWSGSPFGALVMLNEAAGVRLGETQSTSFACDLGKWRQIMAAYEGGGHAYHATMPTDAITAFRDVMAETEADRIRHRDGRAAGARATACAALLAERGFVSVAADGFDAPGVVVSYTDDPDVKNGQQVRGGRTADRRRRAADVWGGRRLLDLPPRPVRPRQAGRRRRRGRSARDRARSDRLIAQLSSSSIS